MNYDVLIIIALSLLLGFSTFISTTGKLIDKRRKGVKSITNNGWTLILTNIAILILLICQYFFNENKLRIKEIETISIQEKRDAILKSRYDSSLLAVKAKFDTSNIKIVSKVTGILGKYGYLLDSTNGVLLKKVKESSNIPDDPVLSCSSFKFFKKTNGVPNYILKIRSYDASSTGYKLKVIFYGIDENGSYKTLLKNDLFSVNDKIPKDLEQPFFFVGTNVDGLYNMIYFNIDGTYTNSDKSKTFTMNEIYYYNTKDQTFGSINFDTRIAEIINLMKSKKLSFYKIK